MNVLARVFLLIFTFISIASANAVSCRDSKIATLYCDPYSTKFIKVGKIKREIKGLKYKPVTNREIPVTERIRVKNGITIHNLIVKYIKREERQYREAEGKITDGSPSSRYSPIEISLIPISIARLPFKTSDEQIVEKSKEEPDKSKITQPKKVFSTLAVYVVQRGDTLSSIAKRFETNMNRLIRLNKLKAEQKLQVNQKLKIPISQERLDAINMAFYVVKRGDSLSSIANSFGVKLSDLKKYNKIRKNSIIHVGQGLTLPLPHKLAELKRIEEKKEKERLKKKRERERLARIALKKKERAKFLKISKGLKRKLSVTATAYTSHRSQTDSTPLLAAWNNRIRPGMKIIAVSRDLIYRYGITNGTKVRISGLRGIYTVRDKMNKKWRRKIDVYMGMNRYRALRWGRRKVTLYY